MELPRNSKKNCIPVKGKKLLRTSTKSKLEIDHMDVRAQVRIETVEHILTQTQTRTITTTIKEDLWKLGLEDFIGPREWSISSG